MSRVDMLKIHTTTKVMFFIMVLFLTIPFFQAPLINNPNIPLVNQEKMYCNLLGCHIIGNLDVSGNIKIDGNVSVKRPYGMFSSHENLTVPIINTPYVINWSETEDTYLMTLSSDKKNISIHQSGDYLIEISIIAQSSAPSTRIWIWVRKNGIDVPRSSTIYDFKSSNMNTVIAVPFIIDMNTTDTFTIMYAGDNTGIKLQALGSNGFAPATPSSIITVSKISEVTP